MVNTFKLVFQNGSKSKPKDQVEGFIKEFEDNEGGIDISNFNKIQNWVYEKLESKLKNDELLNFQSYGEVTNFLASNMIEDMDWIKMLNLGILSIISKTEILKSQSSSPCKEDKLSSIPESEESKIRTDLKKFVNHNGNKIMNNAAKLADNKFSTISVKIDNTDKNKFNKTDISNISNFSVNIVFVLIGMILAFFMTNDMSSSAIKGPINESKTVGKVFQ